MNLADAIKVFLRCDAELAAQFIELQERHNIADTAGVVPCIRTWPVTLQSGSGTLPAVTLREPSPLVITGVGMCVRFDSGSDHLGKLGVLLRDPATDSAELIGTASQYARVQPFVPHTQGGALPYDDQRQITRLVHRVHDKTGLSLSVSRTGMTSGGEFVLATYGYAVRG